MITQKLLSQFNYNRGKAILATPFAYQAFKSKIESAVAPKEDNTGLTGNTIVLTSDKPYAMQGSAAILQFNGFTVSNCSPIEEMLFGCLSLQGFCDKLEQAVSDDSVTDVVINFDSGGGYTMYGDETCELVASLNDIKPIRGYTSGLMASMAYKVASNCEQLIASPTALVGSIGVYSEYFDYTEALAKDGVKVTTFQGGNQKTIGSPYVPLTAEQSAAIQADINNEWESFKAIVRGNRGTVTDSVMQGQAFTGKEAMTLQTNLIDGNINSLKQYVQLISANRNYV